MRYDPNVLPPELGCVMVGQDSVIDVNNEYQTHSAFIKHGVVVGNGPGL
jgi:hypothetical protein